MMHSKFRQGFSIIEFLVGVLITTIAAGSIMYGVVNIRKTTNLLTVRDKAFEELLNYTDFWKSKIAAGEWAGTNSWTNGPSFDLIYQETAVPAILSKKGGVINSNYPYPLYALETKILWWGRSDEQALPPEELNLKVYQIEFK